MAPYGKSDPSTGEPEAPRILPYTSRRRQSPVWRILKRVRPLVQLLRWLRGQIRQRLTRQEIFSKYYRKNYWGDQDSVSGPGSSLATTESLRLGLPALLSRHGIRRLLDVPCGDFRWMSRLEYPLDSYVGGDIVDVLIRENRARYGGPGREFRILDCVEDPLPDADVLLCRDLLQHLSHREITAFFGNLRRSNTPLLLVTDFTGDLEYRDTPTGGWRPLRLTAEPFSFPEPLDAIIEGVPDWATDGRVEKRLALWRVADLPSLA